MPKLSILIPSLIGREKYLARLYDILKPQLSNDIEVLIHTDNKQITTGSKRNNLINDAKGEYIIFVDDDDRVSADYVEQVMVGINRGVDAVTITSIITVDGKNPRFVIDSPYQENRFYKNTYYRGVQHLDAVKRELASQIKYEDISFGEDAKWTKAMHESGLIKTWYRVGKPIYFYESRTKK